jgi:hypothetical protein
MSRDTDWHVFDKACDVTAMAVKGAAATVQPAQLADVFRELYRALRDSAEEIAAEDQKAGF